MKPIFIIFLLVSFYSSAYCQIGLTLKLKKADTVLLISHSMTSRSNNEMVNSEGHTVTMPDLLVNGSLNEKIIIEKKVLTEKEIKALIGILTYTYEPSGIINQGGCFDPHHSIIIKKNSRTSFIDLCFHCFAFEVSKDITKLVIKNDKWDQLYRMFEHYGFKYEMSLEQ